MFAFSGTAAIAPAIGDRSFRPCIRCVAPKLAQLTREEYQCVPKKEAKEGYLLPEGTIAVLKYIERDNPHHSSWTKVSV